MLYCLTFYLSSEFNRIMFESDVMFSLRHKVTSKTALIAGSSKHGKTLRANDGAMNDVAEYLKQNHRR